MGYYVANFLFGIRLVSRSSATGHGRASAFFAADGIFLGWMLFLIPHGRPFLFVGYVVGADGSLFLRRFKAFSHDHPILDT